MNNKDLLIIFTKNPVLGTCKTRLAKTMGDHEALRIYKALIDYTVSFTEKVAAKKHVYYSDFIPELDEWSLPNFEKFMQIDGNLGTKMSNAFSESFKKGFNKVVIIGSDCAEINEKDIQVAFEQLRKHDAVIGPAVDGGYYLLGMNHPILDLFIDKSWSTPELINETISTLKRLNKSFYLLSEKSDIDYEEDLYRQNYLSVEV